METIIIVSAVSASISLPPLLKKIEYKIKKNHYRRQLKNAFKKNDKEKIKKYILKMKDQIPGKLEPLLYEIHKKNKNINLYNLLSLKEDFTLINELYTNEKTILNEIDKKLDEKLKKIQRNKNEVRIRQEKLDQKMSEKSKKMEKNKKIVRRI